MSRGLGDVYKRQRFPLNVDESAVERGIIAEADPKCRFFRRHTLLQPFCGKRHAFGVDIMQNRHSRMSTEQAAKLVFADEMKRCETIEREILGQMVVDIVNERENGFVSARVFPIRTLQKQRGYRLRNGGLQQRFPQIRNCVSFETVQQRKGLPLERNERIG